MFYILNFLSKNCFHFKGVHTESYLLSINLIIFISTPTYMFLIIPAFFNKQTQLAQYLLDSDAVVVIMQEDAIKFLSNMV